MAYNIGDLIRLTAQFTSNITGLLADPATATFVIRDPAGGISAQTPTRDSTGVYHYDLTVAIAGPWQWRATGTGGVQVSGYSSFTVDAGAF